MAGDVGRRLRTRHNENLHVWRSPALEGIVFSRGTQLSHTYPRHWHEELHLCAYTSGRGYLGYRGNSFRVTDRDFVLTPPGEVHENWVDSESSISFCGMYVEMHAFHKGSQSVAGRALSIPSIRDLLMRDPRIRQRFLAMYSAIERRGSQLEQEEEWLEFLHLFLSNCCPETLDDASTEPSAIRRAREYIDEHFADSISLAYLGQLANLSPFHFHRMFRQTVGMPPHAYQTQVRINRAKQLLRQRHPLSSVAFNTGFADQSHLTRHFHRLVGVTPGRFLP
jgi:AraC-like DNA-binding protein